MRWNPFYNAFGASAYIWLIALFFHFIGTTLGNTPDTWVAPIVALSLLVFSVATMGFLFFYHPVTLLLENKKHEAVAYFLKTLGFFGLFGIGAVVLLYTIR